MEAIVVLKGKIVEGGRIIVPARFREQLGLSKGDTIFMEIDDGELRVRPARSALRRIQAKLRGLGTDDGMMSGGPVVKDRVGVDHG